jgi:AcrR family transcriptional regulator
VGRRGETRERVVRAALDLFTEHGVGGCSLQMIADRLGVTKAAVYHQFQTKDDIVLAVVQPALDQMAAILSQVGAITQPGRRRAAAVDALVDLVLEHQQVMAALWGDPGVMETLERHATVTAAIERLQQLLLGPAPTPADLIASAMFGGGLLGIGGDERLLATDRATLRTELIAAAHRLLRL